MNCPIDGTTLAISTREGIEIDYCPECRGVWLDRGELDKIIEREHRFIEERDSDRADGASKASGRAADPPKKKKKVTSFLQDIMEMGQG
jgi:Zn-finger nucleic acid-binding protein